VAIASNGHAMVVDPGAEGALIAEQIPGITVDYVVATHGHGDHVGGVKALLAATGAKFMIGEGDYEYAQQAATGSNFGYKYDDDAPAADVILHDGDIIEVGDLTFTVLEAPGHTPGGLVIYGAGAAFTGDTLFKGTVGRTDLPGSNQEQEFESLRYLAKRIAPETLILAGHGAPTTMAAELETNPFMIAALKEEQA
jgi:glyoxylase-like metal-dependent hydrolase (beta-lactamase superfamily II)